MKKCRTHSTHLSTFAFNIAICTVFLVSAVPGFSQQTPQPDDTQPAPAQQEKPDLPNGKTKQIDSSSALPMASGIVFNDLNENGKFDDGDATYSKVKVSNGKQIVLTDENGRYELPIEEGMAIFVIKPTGFRSPLGKNNLSKFYYFHKPNGSPKLKFRGSKPTGPLPQSIDFPLYQQEEPEAFKIILFGDPQPRNDAEVDYITHDVVSELIGKNDSAFGVTLGDIAFDNLKTFKTINQSIAMIGIPWYNVIGNHDLNLDAKSRKHINETFESTYGPSFYSFDYGQVHFVVLDNIDWAAPNEKSDRYRYFSNFGKRQLEFLKTDLSMIPETQMVCMLMHIPITATKDKAEFYKLIEKRPYCVSISGHTHDHRHLFLGKEEGFNGKKKHHHIVNVTVSGAWWSGAKNDNGIPHTTMADGAPNGYSIMNFDENGYRLDFKAAGQPASQQMRIHLPVFVDANETGEKDIWVNVYNGSEKSTVEMSIDNSQWTPLKKVMTTDPYYAALAKRDEGVQPKPAKPKSSHHLWTGDLPARMQPGAHLIRVKTTDMHGRTYQSHRSIRVSGKLVPKKK